MGRRGKVDTGVWWGARGIRRGGEETRYSYRRSVMHVAYGTALRRSALSTLPLLSDKFNQDVQYAHFMLSVAPPYGPGASVPRSAHPITVRRPGARDCISCIA